MKIFFDTEFIENGPSHFPQLISIGMVREDGETYYAELDVDWSLASDWVLQNVKPHLRGDDFKKNHSVIVTEMYEFCGENPEFWAYFADYDWVIFCGGLFGKMINLPKGWPMFCRDLKQLMWHFNISRDDIPKTLDMINTQPHHALSDAIWNKEVYDWIKEHYNGRSIQF